MSLPVLPPETTANQDCPGCSRRTLLQGIGVATVGTMIACGGGAADDGSGVDGTPGGDGGVDPGYTVSGNDVLIDLTKSVNSALASVNGFKVYTIKEKSNKKIIVSQPASGTFAATSAVCTHAGCTVGYSTNGPKLLCPCHGSQYMLDGTVIQGPAVASLTKFNTSFASNVVTVTIS